MADNALTITSKLQFVKNNQTFTNQVQQKIESSNTAADSGHHTTQAVATSAEDVSVGDVDVASEHYVQLRNQDTVNYVDVIFKIDASNSGIAGRMRPGGSFGPVRAIGQTATYPRYQMQANTAACNVEVLVTDAGVPTS